MTDKPKPIIIARHDLARLNSIRDWVWDDPMHVFLSDLIHTALHYLDEAERLRGDLKEALAEGYACGRLEGFVGIFAGGCGQHIDVAESYRCADCTASFHRDCIRKHFVSHNKQALGDK